MIAHLSTVLHVSSVLSPVTHSAGYQEQGLVAAVLTIESAIVAGRGAGLVRSILVMIVR